MLLPDSTKQEENVCSTHLKMTWYKKGCLQPQKWLPEEFANKSFHLVYLPLIKTFIAMKYNKDCDIMYFFIWSKWPVDGGEQFSLVILQVDSGSGEYSSSGRVLICNIVHRQWSQIFEGDSPIDDRWLTWCGLQCWTRGRETYRRRACFERGKIVKRDKAFYF